MRNFEFKDSSSNKFWHIVLAGSSFTVTFGRIGTNGQTQTKFFANAAIAKQEHDKLVAQKLKKGYVETTPATAVAPAPIIPNEQKALEAALADHADEVAAHSAYADYLMEQGDPRGDFIQVQLSLEDPTRPKKERDSLRKREAALLKDPVKEWLGDAGPPLVGSWSGEGKPINYRFARGWPDFIRVLPFPDAVIARIARSPEMRLLRRLEIVYDMEYHSHSFHEFVMGQNTGLPEEERANLGGYYMSEPGHLLPPLLNSPYLKNLRVFKFGFSDQEYAHSTMVNPFGNCTAKLMLDFMANCPRLEELHLNTALSGIKSLLTSPQLGNLRVLQYYYGSAEYYGGNRPPPNPYPLGEFAKNKSLANLTTLRLHPGRDATIDIDELDALLKSKNLPALRHLQIHMTVFEDEGAERIVSSGILKRLKTLDIGYGNMTDDGARMIAECADFKNLEVLDVSRNALTRTGVKALQKTGVRVIADDQHDGEENDYLYEVDHE